MAIVLGYVAHVAWCYCRMQHASFSEQIHPHQKSWQSTSASKFPTSSISAQFYDYTLNIASRIVFLSGKFISLKTNDINQLAKPRLMRSLKVQKTHPVIDTGLALRIRLVRDVSDTA